jgi:hypothetical protein
MHNRRNLGSRALKVFQTFTGVGDVCAGESLDLIGKLVTSIGGAHTSSTVHSVVPLPPCR